MENRRGVAYAPGKRRCRCRKFAAGLHEYGDAGVLSLLMDKLMNATLAVIGNASFFQHLDRDGYACWLPKRYRVLRTRVPPRT